MKPVEPKPPTIGEPLPLSMEELDQWAMPTPVDVATARVLWRLHAPPPLTDLLDAKADAD